MSLIKNAALYNMRICSKRNQCYR